MTFYNLFKMIDEVEFKEPVAQIRRGGKQKTNKPQLKHSNFFIIIETDCPPEAKEEYKNYLIELSDKIKSEYLLVGASQQAHKVNGLPLDGTREELLQRLEGAPVIRFGSDTYADNKLRLFYLYCLHKRGLDTQLQPQNVIDFLKSKGKNCRIRLLTYHDARGDINNYISKNCK